MSMDFLQGVTAYILSPDCDKHIEWMKTVLGGEEKFLFRSEDKKKVAHAAIAINGGCLYLTDLSHEKAVKAINDISVDVGRLDIDANGSYDDDSRPHGFILHLDVADPDAIWQKAMSSGCTVEKELKVQSWGCYYGLFRDPFGFPWALAKITENSKRGVVPYILTTGGECENQIEWLKAVFGAEVKEKFCSDDGSTIQHCAVAINGYTIYLADEIESKVESLHGKPKYFHCHLDMPNPKAVWEKAMANGAKTIVNLEVQFWGELQGTFEDKFGSRWSLSPPSNSGPPVNSPGVVAYLLSPDCKEHIEFIKKIFDGKVRATYNASDGEKIMHCSMTVNGGELFLCDQLCGGDTAALAWPKRGDACGFMCHLNLSDPDAVWKKAMENGCTQVMELKQQYWGDYYGIFKDPLGYGWALRKEN